MKRTSLVAVFILLATLGATALCGTVATDVVAPAVEIQTSDGKCLGSGTLIKVAGETLVLTAAHVVEDCKPLKSAIDKSTLRPVAYVNWQTKGRSETRKCHVVFVTPDEESGGRDLALLKLVDATGLPSATVLSACKHLELGETCYYCGSGAGLHRSLERSIISRIEAEVAGYDFTVVNGCVWYGHSGSGMFVQRDGKWFLAGVVVRVFKPRSDPKAPGLCQTPETIREFLAAYAKSKTKGRK